VLDQLARQAARVSSFATAWTSGIDSGIDPLPDEATGAVGI